ncbi:hypothetical protein Prudu_012193 [Prunus dulcis]|uniref:Uncharacterized protein n=1 Tax=Prunus dulcis TaxID=3755 RepID=A0A4Y1RC52_PRUDU|nr:hypothetical protein Prudu_012193 [Prunus dulcis]
MARGPSCSRSRSGSEESVRGKDSDTSVTYRLVREYCGIEVDVDKLENAFTGTSPASAVGPFYKEIRFLEFSGLLIFHPSAGYDDGSFSLCKGEFARHTKTPQHNDVPCSVLFWRGW